MTRRHAGLGAAVVLGGVLVGCSSSGLQPTAPPGEMIQKACLSDAADIGPDGGVLSCGPYTLTIPAGALAYTAHITMEQESCNQWPVRLSPDGTQFAVPAILAFDAAQEPDPGSMSVSWWNPSSSQWLPQDTKHDGTVVWSEISHFSRWIIY